jgi:serine protease AprX
MDSKGAKAMWRRLLLVLALLGPLSVGTVRNAVNAAPLIRTEKISPWVLDATAGGGQTDFLIVLAEQADLSAAYALPTKQARGQWVYETLWETAQRSQAPLRAWLDARGASYRSYYIVNLLHVQAGDRALVETLSARPDVARIEANPRIQNKLPETRFLERNPASPSAIEWNVSKVNAPAVWAMGYTGQGVVVGGQDTGYDWDHPALKNQYRGWNGAAANHDYNWHDAIHGAGGDSPAPIDPHSHGTHTMGIVLGDDGGNNQIGVAPGARWVGCRNMDSGGRGTPITYLECFEFFLAPYPVGSDPAQGDPNLAPDVTNNSWGCPASEGCSWGMLQAAVEAQRAAGIMTVVSAGNGGSSGCSSVDDPPALYDAAYSVGSTDSSDLIASTSSRGPVTIDGSGRLKPDISAPGVGVRSSLPGTGYGLMSGTSMAAPHVAGAVALLWSAQPALRNQIDLTEDILNETAVPRYSTQCGDPPYTVPNNVYGWGRLDALAAVQRVLDGAGYLSGAVSNDGGAPIVGAEVQAANGLAQAWRTTSVAGGLYSLTLVSDTYTVTVTAPGYTPYLVASVTITADSTTTLNITLSVTPTYIISGHVRDVYTDQPLSATVSLPGSSLTSTQTAPATGFYSLTAQMGVHTMQVEADHYLSQQRLVDLTGDRTEDFALAPLCLLVVDDDEGMEYEAYYTNALDRLGYTYGTTDIPPDVATLAHYQGVIWLTGSDSTTSLTPADQASLASYLDGGGRLFLSGQNVGFDIGNAPFYADYLHALYDSDDTQTYTLTGLGFLSGRDVVITGGDGVSQAQPSDIEPVNGGAAVYDYPAPHLYGGVAYSGVHRAVYLSFGYEGINSQADRDGVMSATLGYLGVCGVPEKPRAGFVSSSPDDWGMRMVFTNTTRGTAWMTYTWDLDGTAVSAEANPEHVYAHPGDYTVTLTATSRYGQDVYTDTVTVNQILTYYTLTIATDGTGTGMVTPSVGAHIYLSGTVVAITATADPGSVFDGWSGDLSGTANLTAILMDAAKTVTATFVATGCVAISGADFAFVPAEPLVGETVTFTGTAVEGTAVLPITYTWNFGDESTIQVGNPVTHTFPVTVADSTYTVTLIVANACPSQQAVEKTMSVRIRDKVYLPLVLRSYP